MAPVHVVELMNVPAELRLESRERTEYSIDVGLERGRGPIPVGSERARVVKTRYGAWYLPVNLWRMKLNEVRAITFVLSLFEFPVTLLTVTAVSQ